MARHPQINRASAVEAAIEIIDAEGLDALSLPRLARELGIRAPSLYNHFTDKSEILAAVARQIASAASIPDQKPGPDWPETIIAMCSHLRTSILQHRNAAPLLLQYLPRDLLIGAYETTSILLRASGVPPSLHVRILDGAERLTLGAALTEAVRSPSTRKTIFPNVNSSTMPELAAALEANELSTEEIFIETLRGFLYSVANEPATSVQKLAQDHISVP